MRFILLILQVDALPKTLEMQESAKHKGHSDLCSEFTVISFLRTRSMAVIDCKLDLVMIRQLGIDNRAFVVSPDSVWYASVLLLFSASAMTDTGSKSLECHGALVS